MREANRAARRRFGGARGVAVELPRRATPLLNAAEQARRAATSARGARERLAALRREREALGPVARRARAQLDLQIECQSVAQARRDAELTRAQENALSAQEATEQWLEDNGAALAELCAAEHELTRRRAQAHERALQAARIEPSEQLRNHLGERPERLAGREQWDHAAAALLQYEQRFGELPGPVEPSDVGRRRAWRSLQRALEPLDRDMSPTARLTLRTVWTPATTLTSIPSQARERPRPPVADPSYALSELGSPLAMMLEARRVLLGAAEGAGIVGRSGLSRNGP